MTLFSAHGITGTFTAMITPFTEKNQLDVEGFIHNLHMQLEGGVQGVVILGTTGECPTVTEKEREKIISTAVREAKGKMYVIVGTGCNSTHNTIDNTKIAKDLGADAALVVTPYYNRPNQEGLFSHFQEINSRVDFPFVAYNVPSRTGVNMHSETVAKISSLKNCIGLKDEICQLSDILQLTTLPVLSSVDALTVPMISLGAQGVISVLSNLLPKKIVAKVGAALAGDFTLAKKLHYELMPLMKASFIDTNPIPIKMMMQLKNLPSGAPRLPLMPLNAAYTQMIKELL